MTLQPETEVREGAPRRSRPGHKLVVTSLVALTVLLAAVGVLYIFGTPESSSPNEAASSSADAAQGKLPTAGEGTDGSPVSSQAPAGQEVSDAASAGKVDPNARPPAPDPSSPLAIEIPGCVCHSDDPALVKSHAEYRMNQCAGCHLSGIRMGK